MPQFDIIWFPSQIFWFAISLSGFGLLCSRAIIPTILKAQHARQKNIDSILHSAKQMLQQADKIKSDIDVKILAAKEASKVIIAQAKKVAEEEHNSSNEQANDIISSYASTKVAESHKAMAIKKIDAIKSIETITEKIAKKSGIKHIALSAQTIAQMEIQLSNF